VTLCDSPYNIVPNADGTCIKQRHTNATKFLAWVAIRMDDTRFLELAFPLSQCDGLCPSRNVIVAGRRAATVGETFIELAQGGQGYAANLGGLSGGRHFGRDDHAAGNGLAILIGANLDLLELAGDDVPLGAIFHMLDLHRDVIGPILGDG
jgi:hypothetical protein